MVGTIMKTNRSRVWMIDSRSRIENGTELGFSKDLYPALIGLAIRNHSMFKPRSSKKKEGSKLINALCPCCFIMSGGARKISHLGSKIEVKISRIH